MKVAFEKLSNMIDQIVVDPLTKGKLIQFSRMSRDKLSWATVCAAIRRNRGANFQDTGQDVRRPRGPTLQGQLPADFCLPDRGCRSPLPAHARGRRSRRWATCPALGRLSRAHDVHEGPAP